MNGSSRIAQIHGYAVCLVAVVTLLIASSRFVDAAFDRASPLQSQNFRYGPWDGSLTSFEAFRASYRRERPVPMRPGPDGAPLPVDTLTAAELRQRYDALRADRIERVRWGATQQLVKHGLLMLLAIGLFIGHWRWVRERR